MSGREGAGWVSGIGYQLGNEFCCCHITCIPKGLMIARRCLVPDPRVLKRSGSGAAIKALDTGDAEMEETS